MRLNNYFMKIEMSMKIIGFVLILMFLYVLPLAANAQQNEKQNTQKIENNKNNDTNNINDINSRRNNNHSKDNNGNNNINKINTAIDCPVACKTRCNIDPKTCRKVLRLKEKENENNKKDTAKLNISQ